MKSSIAFFAIIFISAVTFSQQKSYTCPPCGCASDGKVFHSPGSCPSCQMKLLNKDNKSEGLNYTNLEPQEVCDKVKENPDILLLDVRTSREYNSSSLGRLKGAKHIHIEELEDRVGELEEYKDKEIIVYCLVGIRSARGAEFLSENGFSKVSNMLGGMDLWNKESTDSLTCKVSLRENSR